jgi:hypothetical protein
MTDRGRIYIVYGPPDEIDSHTGGGTYQSPIEEGGGETSTFPFEDWSYRYIEGIGQEIIIEFVDDCQCGAYEMTMDAAERCSLTYRVRVDLYESGMAQSQSLCSGLESLGNGPMSSQLQTRVRSSGGVLRS